MSVTDGLPAPRKYWALSATMTAMSMTVLESTITNIGLPNISAALDILPAQAVWIVNAYQLAIVILMLPCAAMGEIYGYRRLFVFGMTVFTASSAGCALASGFEQLIAFRLLQGLGAACTMGVTPALMRFIYSQKQYGRAIGFNALVVSVSSAAGPMVGSLILAVAPWPWLFGVNVPLGIYAVVMGLRVLPRTELAKRPFDWTSASLCGLFFGLLVVSLDHLLSNTLLALLGLAVSGLTGLVLYRREMSRTAPLLPLDLLRIKTFAYSICASICTFAAQTIAFISLPFFFRHDMMRDQIATGMLMIPWPIATAIVAPIAGRLTESIPPSRLCMVGTALLSATLIVIVLLPQQAPDAAIMTCMALAGMGFGMFQTPNNRTMLTAAPRNRSGGAGGMQGTARQFGMACGAALTALTFTAIPAHGYAAGIIVAAILMAASSAISMAKGGPTLE